MIKKETKENREQPAKPTHLFMSFGHVLSQTGCPGSSLKGYETLHNIGLGCSSKNPSLFLSKVYFHYELYQKEIQEKFVPELAVLLKILSIYRHRRIYITKRPLSRIEELSQEVGVSKKLVYRAISKFLSIGIISKEKEGSTTFWKIKSHKEIELLLGAKKGKVHYWDPRKVKSFEDLKKFIVCLPVLSNINVQSKYVRYHNDLCKKRDSVRYKFSPVFRKKVDHEFSKIKVIQETPILSVERIASIIGTTVRTAVKYKNFLRKNRFIVSVPRLKKIGNAESNYAGRKAKKFDSFERNIFVTKTGILVEKLASGIIPLYLSN